MLIPIIQMVVAVVLIILILLQERSAGLGGMFGGEIGGIYQVRRGFEKLIFWSTIVLAVIFLALAVVQLLY